LKDSGLEDKSAINKDGVLRMRSEQTLVEVVVEPECDAQRNGRVRVAGDHVLKITIRQTCCELAWQLSIKVHNN